MQIGRRLLIDKSTNKVIHEFVEMNGEVLPRPDINNLILIDLEYGKYSEEFTRLKDGLNSVKVVGIENKILEFDLREQIQTSEQQIAELQQKLLQAQGVV
jgi:hypothetical protein